MFVALDATYLVDPHPSGIAVYSHELLDGLARYYPNDSFLHLYRLKQYRKSARTNFVNVKRGLLMPPLPVSAAWRKPDIFHALNQRVDFRPGRRVISTFHDLFVMTGEYSSADFRKRFAEQARRAAERSDLIIAVSEFTKSQVVSHLKVEAARVRVVPHGVSLPGDVPPLAGREKMILCVGALQVRKNVTRLVEAFERLPEKVRDGWRLVLAGSTAGFGAASIVAGIERSRVASQVQLRGYVTASELRDLYRRALIFAFPSLDEGFGIPVLEAMAHGVPVITSNRSALPEVAGDAAMMIDPQDEAALTLALADLMTDRDKRNNLSELGRLRATVFPWERAVNETHAIYREATA